VLTLEHRAAAGKLDFSAKPPDPIELQLLSKPDGSETHLEPTICSENGANSLHERIVVLLGNSSIPLTRSALRERLKVNNQRLGAALTDLEKQRVAIRSAKGWVFTENQQEETVALPEPRGSKQCRPKQRELPF